jgi:hypothetical protein
VVKVKASQKIFTDTETANLTGICLEHLHGLACRRHLGFIARAAEVAGMQPDQWLFTRSDLMVLVMLHPRCQHEAAQTCWQPTNREGGSNACNEPTTDWELLRSTRGSDVQLVAMTCLFPP